MQTLIFFRPDFEKELRDELAGRNLAPVSDGVLVLGQDLDHAVWAQQLWRNSEILNFESITHAASILRQFSKGPWINASVSHFRRSQLISEKLKIQKDVALGFLSTKAHQKVSGFALISENQMWVAQDIRIPFARGEVKMQESPKPPSRAYLKLWELFTFHGLAPAADDVCLDLGSCPGGWTWVLAEMGCRILSVDKADIAADLQRRKNVNFIQRDAFSLKPTQFIAEHGAVDWLFSDIICEPSRLFELVTLWLDQTEIKNFVTTVKFKGKTDSTSLKRFLQIKGSRALHLFHNKHEVTWVLRRD